MKILLVEIHNSEEVWNGLGVGYLCACLFQEGYRPELKLLHPGSDIETFISEVKKENYDIIGFSSSFYNSSNFAMNVIVRLRNEGIKSHIIMGGHTPSFYFEKIMDCFPEVDSIAFGEGENTLLEFAEKFNTPSRWSEIKGLIYRKGNEFIVNKPVKLIEDLDSLPYPCRTQYVHKDLETDISSLNKTVDYAMKRRMMVTTSRGCYGRCAFCSVFHFYNYNVRRGRTVKNVVGEIEELVNKYGARIIAFNDDNFFNPRDKENKWYYEFADELEKRKLDIIFNFQCRPNEVDFDLFSRLKEVGLHYVFIGTESFIPRTLKLFRKGLTVETNLKALETLKKLHMDYQAGLIVFDPFSTSDEIKESFRVIKSLYDIYDYTSPLWIDRLRIYYGTEIYRILLEKNMLEGDFPNYYYRIRDDKVESLYRIISESVKDYVKTVTEPETMLAPQACNLLFLWGITYLKNLPSVKKGEINYLPEEIVRELSVKGSYFFLDLIFEAIDLLDKDPGEKEKEEFILYFKDKYNKENERFKEIIKEGIVSKV